MALQILKQPPVYTWSQDPVIFSFAYLPYGLPQVSQDIIAKVSIYVDSNTGNPVREETLYPNASGHFLIDIASIADAYLQNEFPALYDISGAKQFVSSKQSRKFFIEAKVSVNNTVATDVLQAETRIIKGGLGKSGFRHYAEMLDPPALLFLSSSSQIHFQQPFIALSFLATQAVNTPIVLQDGTVSYSFPNPNMVAGQVLHLIFENTATTQVHSRNFAITNLSDTITLPVENNPGPVGDHLLWINSLGGIDTITLYKGRQTTYDFTQNTATKPSGAEVETSAIAKAKTNSNTGYISKAAWLTVQSLFFAQLVLRHVRSTFLESIVLAKKNLSSADTSGFLHDVPVEYAVASESRFNHLGQQPIDEQPFIENIRGIKFNNTNVQLTYTTGGGATSVRIATSAGAATDTSQPGFVGHDPAGSVLIPIPATFTAPGTLTLYAAAYKPDIFGQFVSTVDIPISTDNTPVAVNDSFTLGTGHTTPQAMITSVLQNDYDPDGDSIECVPVFGAATQQGGTISINAAGQVLYTPPNAAFTGADQFAYTIQNTGGTNQTTGLILFNVTASGVTEMVYAQLRLQITSNSAYITQGRYTLYFFSNALCTIPKDVTSFRINFNLEWTTLSSGATTTQTTQVVGVGTSTFAGDYIQLRQPITYNITAYNYIALKPGAGYTVA